MGSYLTKPITKKKTLVERSSGIKYTASQMQGWRKNMEDAQIHKVNVQQYVSVFGIFDGHGGPQVAKFVQKKFIQYLTKDEKFIFQDYKNALINTFVRMDELLLKDSKYQLVEIRQQLSQNQNYIIQKPFQRIIYQVGCTANVLIITPQLYIVANAGDSRCVLSRNKTAHPMSIDNKPNDLAQKSRIQKAGGYVSNGRINGGLNLSRGIGDFDYKSNQQLQWDQQLIICKPQIIQLKREQRKDDFIIMGCDGIWQKYDNQQMVDLIHKRLSQGRLNSQNLVEQLLDSFLAKQTSEQKGCDNMSIILIEFPDSYKGQ